MLYQKLLLGTDPYFFSAGKGIPFENHRHPEIELSFCIEGGYTVVAEGKEHQLKKGDLAIFGPMAAHEYTEDIDPTTKRVTVEIGPAMLREYFEPLVSRLSAYQVYSLQDNSSPLCSELYALLVEAATAETESSPFRELIIKGNLYKICALLLQLVFKSNADRIPEKSLKDVGKIEKALELIYNRYNEPLDIDSVSTACGYGKSNFCKTFKAVTGETFHELLNRHRVEIACLHLKESGNIIEQIALSVGFSDSKSFCRVFKKIIGESAGSYRKKL